MSRKYPAKKTARVTISLDADLWDLAQSLCENNSAFVAQAIREKVGKELLEAEIRARRSARGAKGLL